MKTFNGFERGVVSFWENRKIRKTQKGRNESHHNPWNINDKRTERRIPLGVLAAPERRRKRENTHNTPPPINIAVGRQ
jgi:hypothetical protein